MNMFILYILHAIRIDKQTDNRRQRGRRAEEKSKELVIVSSRLAAQTGADSVNVT